MEMIKAISFDNSEVRVECIIFPEKGTKSLFLGMSEMDTTQKQLCDCAVQIHSPYAAAAGGAGSSDTTAVIRLGSGTLRGRAG